HPPMSTTTQPAPVPHFSHAVTPSSHPDPLSLPDALPICTGISLSTLSRLESGQRKPTLELLLPLAKAHGVQLDDLVGAPPTGDRSEEHTSELQSRENLVCRLLREKKKKWSGPA